MNLKTPFLLAGAVAAGAIAVAAAVVLTGSEPMASPEQTPQLSAAAVDAEQPQPDPEARGVIIANSLSFVYGFTAQGERQPISRIPPPPNGVSPDGLWQAGIDCDEDGCFVAVFDLQDPDDAGQKKSIRLGASFTGGEWAPQASLLAALDEDGGLYLVDPVSGEANLVEQDVTAYAWTAGDRLIFATQDASGARLSRLDERGLPLELAVLSGPIQRFFVSPERDQVVFTQEAAVGWSLLSLSSRDGTISDYGHVGANMGWSNTAAPTTAPELAVAWSPDGNQFAVGPVSYPYALHVVTPGSQPTVRTLFFLEGYAGELSWSPDGSRLAISTYSLDRTQHEVYMLDVATGAAPRHLLDGCKIVWSPDGKFIAVKREPHDATGIAAVRVDTGFNWPLTTHPEFVPVSWGADTEEALALTMKPLPYAVQLGK